MFDALPNSDLVPLVAAGVAGALAFLLLSRFLGRKSAKNAPSLKGIEQQFRTVFGLTPMDRREALIEHYMTRHNCGRREAMKIAIEARQADEERW